MDHSHDEPGSRALVSQTAHPGRGSQIERLARLLEIGIDDLAPDVPLHPINSDPAGLDGHAVFDFELAGALGRVEDHKTRLHLERLLRTLETLRRGHLRSATGDVGGDGIDDGDGPRRGSGA